MKIFRNFEVYIGMCVWGGGELKSQCYAPLAIEQIWQSPPSSPMQVLVAGHFYQVYIVKVYRTHLVICGIQAYNVLVTDTDYIHCRLVLTELPYNHGPSISSNIFPYRKNISTKFIKFKKFKELPVCFSKINLERTMSFHV